IADDTRSQVRERTDVEYDPAVNDLLQEPRVLDGADAVAHPLRAERLERAANRLRACGLPGVRNGCQARCPRLREDPPVGLRRKLGLEAAETDPEHAPVAVLPRVAHGRLRFVEAETPGDVGSQPHLDSVQLAGFVRSVAVAAVDLVPVDTPAGTLGRGEDPLDVHRSMRRGLLGVVHHALLE